MDCTSPKPIKMYESEKVVELTRTKIQAFPHLEKAFRGSVYATPLEHRKRNKVTVP